MGLISDIKRKTLPEIAKIVGLESAEGLDNFFTDSPWSVEEVKKRRMNYPAASGRGIRIKIDSIVDFGVAGDILYLVL